MMSLHPDPAAESSAPPATPIPLVAGRRLGRGSTHDVYAIRDAVDTVGMVPTVAMPAADIGISPRLQRALAAVSTDATYGHEAPGPERDRAQALDARIRTLGQHRFMRVYGTASLATAEGPVSATIAERVHGRPLTTPHAVATILIGAAAHTQAQYHLHRLPDPFYDDDLAPQNLMRESRAGLPSFVGIDHGNKVALRDPPTGLHRGTPGFYDARVIHALDILRGDPATPLREVAEYADRAAHFAMGAIILDAISGVWPVDGKAYARAVGRPLSPQTAPTNASWQHVLSLSSDQERTAEPLALATRAVRYERGAPAADHFHQMMHTILVADGSRGHSLLDAVDGVVTWVERWKESR